MHLKDFVLAMANDAALADAFAADPLAVSSAHGLNEHEANALVSGEEANINAACGFAAGCSVAKFIFVTEPSRQLPLAKAA